MKHVISRWLLLACFLVFNAKAVGAAPFQIKIAEAHVVVQRTGTDDVIDLGSQKLPWKWDSAFPKQSGIAHFTIPLEFGIAQFDALLASGASIGFSAAKIGNRYRFRFNNGNWQSVGWDEKTTQYKTKPRWHALPISAMRKGANTLELELRFEPANDAGLSVIELGDAETTFVIFQNGSNVIQFTALVVSLISTLIGIFALAMWRINKERMFALAGVAEFIFAIRQLAIFVDYPPVDTWIWNTFFELLFAWYTGIICQISSILIYKAAPKMNSIVQVFMGFSLPVLLLGNALGDYRYYQYWLAVMLLMSALHLTRMTWFALCTTDINLRMYTAASVIAILFGLYDFLAIQNNAEGLGKVRLSTFTALLFNITLAAIIVRKFIAIQRESIRTRLDASIQQEQAKFGERHRIMTELHDSVGSQLVGLLGLIKGGAQQKLIETQTLETLQELRIAVDAIQPVNGNLAAVLATLRHRLQPRLDAHNLRLIWRVDDLPRIQSLTPQGVQNIQRILLEAFTNIMLHAKAKTITVYAANLPVQNLVKISICDDGVGFELGKLETLGQGLKNMHSRAEALGAAIHFEQGKPDGTCINLLISNK
jgi:signal transduction histidine kinase